MRTLRVFAAVAVAALLLTLSTLPAQASRTLLHIEIADADVRADRSVKVRLFYSCPGGSDLGVEGNASLWVFQLRDGIFVRSVTAESLFDLMTCDGTNRLLVHTFRRDIDGRRFIADLPPKAKAAGKTVEIVVYPDAPHGFHADYRPSYRQADAEDGWKRMLAWFARYGMAPAKS